MWSKIRKTLVSTAKLFSTTKRYVVFFIQCLLHKELSKWTMLNRTNGYMSPFLHICCHMCRDYHLLSYLCPVGPNRADNEIRVWKLYLSFCHRLLRKTHYKYWWKFTRSMRLRNVVNIKKCLTVIPVLTDHSMSRPCNWYELCPDDFCRTVVFCRNQVFYHLVCDYDMWRMGCTPNRMSWTFAPFSSSHCVCKLI